VWSAQGRHGTSEVRTHRRGLWMRCTATGVSRGTSVSRFVPRKPLWLGGGRMHASVRVRACRAGVLTRRHHDVCAQRCMHAHGPEFGTWHACMPGRFACMHACNVCMLRYVQCMHAAMRAMYACCDACFASMYLLVRMHGSMQISK
jgi:hypothetical protein